MNCPACDGEFRERKIAGIALDECGSCNGIWFDGDELEKYRSALAPPPRSAGDAFIPRDDLARRACPRCRVLTLASGSMRGRRTFRCTNCRGVFLSNAAVRSLGNVKAAAVVEGSGILDFVDGETIVEIVLEIVCLLGDW